MGNRLCPLCSWTYPPADVEGLLELTRNTTTCKLGKSGSSPFKSQRPAPTGPADGVGRPLSIVDVRFAPFRKSAPTPRHELHAL